jgi:hypothetical protein
MLTARAVSRVDSFHTHVEAYDEIVEVEAYAKTVTDSQLFPEFRKLELPARLVGIFPECPDVASIDKQRSTEFPEKVGTVLGVQVKLHVASLVDEVNAPIVTHKLSWSE